MLDTGALVALERSNRRVALRIRQALTAGDRVVISAGCVAQAWRDGGTQVGLAKLLKEHTTKVEPLDTTAARQIGRLLARSGTADIVDGHVALVALQTGGTVLTSDPDDIRRLAPTASVIRV